ncbi:MAG: DUF1501 domain-containing protein [Acidobacteriota bacterium]
MNVTRRKFIRDGVTAFTLSFGAPAFISELARAQGASRRNLVVLYLSGGNDALSTIIPYTDPHYYRLRPSIFVPAANVLQIGSDGNKRPLGLHPRLTGLKQIFEAGHLAFIQRTGYPNSSRSHFQGTDIWSTANPANSVGAGWLGRYLDSLPSPVDALAGWSTTREVPHTLIGQKVSVPAIPSVAGYSLQSPNSGLEATYSRQAMTALASHLPPDRPHLSFVNGTTQAAIATLDRVGSVASYGGTVTYPNDALSQAFKAVAGAMVRGIGTKVFWVQTGGFDTHATQNTNAVANIGYAGLMNTLNTSLLTFYNDLRNQGLLQDTLVIQFSEFGRRIGENGTNGTDHGAAGMMMVMGGGVSGGIYGTAADLNPFKGNTTLENDGGDVTYETDFRSVYARVIDNWLGADSVSVLGSNFRKAALNFV